MQLAVGTDMRVLEVMPCILGYQWKDPLILSPYRSKGRQRECKIPITTCEGHIFYELLLALYKHVKESGCRY